MTSKISKNVYKFECDSNAYLIIDKKIIIDTGRPSNKRYLKKEIEKIINPDEIDIVIFTHFHYDHLGALEIFKNAKFYASSDEINDFNKNPFEAILNDNTLNKISKLGITFNDIICLKIKGLKAIKTPGHTNGSICLIYDDKGTKILFSGDTIFDTCVGRTDLPTSNPDKVQKSLDKLAKLEFDILAPGHDY